MIPNIWLSGRSNWPNWTVNLQLNNRQRVPFRQKCKQATFWRALDSYWRSLLTLTPRAAVLTCLRVNSSSHTGEVSVGRDEDIFHCTSRAEWWLVLWSQPTESSSYSICTSLPWSCDPQRELISVTLLPFRMPVVSQSFLPSHFRLICPTFVPLFISHLGIFLCTHVENIPPPQSFSLLVFHSIYFSCLSLLPLALSSGLHLLYSVSKPPAIAFTLQVIHNLSLIWTGAALHSFPVWTLHLSHRSSIFFRSLLSLSWLLFPWISYFPTFCPLFVPSLPDGIPSFSSLSLFIGIICLTVSFLSHDLHMLTRSSWKDVTFESENTKWIFICLGITSPEYLYAVNSRRVCLLQRNISFD